MIAKNQQSIHRQARSSKFLTQHCVGFFPGRAGLFPDILKNRSFTLEKESDHHVVLIALVKFAVRYYHRVSEGQRWKNW